jgi:hypothetical protein
VVFAGNQYEKQAQFSVLFGVLGGLAAAAGVALTLQNFRWDSFEFFYNPKGMRLLMVLGACGLGGLAGVVALYTGFVSAGHKRNRFSHLSWLGYWFGAAALTLALCTFALAFLTKQEIG